MVHQNPCDLSNIYRSFLKQLKQGRVLSPDFVYGFAVI